MKFNKKKLLAFGVFGMFAMVMVTASLIQYYGQSTHEINVESPVEYIGNDIYTVEGDYAGTVLEGDELGMKNHADFEVLMQISDDSDLPKNNGIETTYKGNLELTKKTVDFELDVWEVLGNKVQIEYTVFGDEFNAEVVGTPIEGYVLVYYADNDDRFANPGEAVLVEDVLGNLPAVDDENADLNDYSLEYPTTPFGAKIWYVPSDAILGGVINWARANEFYFESSLIQYNEEGQIIVYPGETLDFTPEFDVSLLFTGTADITTSVAPVM